MASIYCYSYAEPKLNLLGVVDDFLSFNFNRSYSGIGEWQLVIDGSSLNATRIKGMDFISLADGVAGYVQRTEDIVENGVHTITYSGVELKGLASKRIVIPPEGKAYEYYRKSPEYVIANLINNHIISPTDASRKMFGSIAAYEEQDLKITYNGRFCNLAEEIEELATAYNIGWCASIINNAIVWQIWHGVDRTAAQTANNRMILDYEYGTMNNSSLIVEDGIPTFMLVAGQGEGVARAIYTMDNAEKGINRVETYIDARDIEDESLLPQRGEEKLAEFGDSYNYTATLSNQAAKQYRNDFDLGDIGTVRDEKLAEPLDYRITSIEEVYEGNQITINMVFGYDKTLLKDAIKRMNSKRDALLAVEGSGASEANLETATGTLAISKGGTGATDKTTALSNLGAAPAQHTHDYSPSNHTHTPSSLGAAEATHTHTQYYPTNYFIYSSTQPTGTATGQIWLKPV